MLFSCSRQSWINEPKAESLTELGRRRVSEFANLTKVAKINLQAFFAKTGGDIFFSEEGKLTDFLSKLLSKTQVCKSFHVKKNHKKYKYILGNLFVKQNLLFTIFLLFFFWWVWLTPHQQIQGYGQVCKWVSKT